MKIVSQLDADGFFVNATVADESPLEPGIFLMPAGAFDILPPATLGGKRAKLVNGTWELLSIPVPESVVPNCAEPTPQEMLSAWRESASVSRFQARVALYQAGHLEATELLMADPDTPMLSRLAWQDAQAFRRNSPTVAALAVALELTDEALDALFVAASEITA